MAFNPHRSWAVTYNQMWNLSMKDPLPRNMSINKGTSYSGFHGNNNHSKTSGGSSGGHEKKSD